MITDALVHQYPQCCLNISYIGPVSYRNITVRASSIRKWQYVQNWKISCYWLFHWQSLTWNLAIAIFIFRKPNHEEFKHVVKKGTTLQEKRYEIIRDVCLTTYIPGLMRTDSINPCLFTICSWRCTWGYLVFHTYQICWWPINLDVFFSSTEKRKQLFVAGKGTFILRSDFKKSVQLKTHQGWVTHCDAITRNPLFTGTGTRAGTHRIWRQSPAGTGTASRHARATQCASQLRQNSRQYWMRTCCMDKKHIHLGIKQVWAKWPDHANQPVHGLHMCLWRASLFLYEHDLMKPKYSSAMWIYTPRNSLNPSEFGSPKAQAFWTIYHKQYRCKEQAFQSSFSERSFGFYFA